MRGKMFLWYRDNQDVALDEPYTLTCQRVTEAAGVTYVHGRAEADDPDVDLVVGEPYGTSVHGIPAARLVLADPGPGDCVQVL